MEMELGKDGRSLGRRGKAGLMVASVLAIIMGAFAVIASLTINHDCESYLGCVPGDELTPIIATGLVAAVLLFAAAGIAISVIRSEPTIRGRAPLALAVGSIGVGVWLVWVLLAMAAAVRATT